LRGALPGLWLGAGTAGRGGGLDVTSRRLRPFPFCTQPTEGSCMSILWIILIVVVVLALFGFIGRGYW
jgi:hypothetical protein